VIHPNGIWGTPAEGSIGDTTDVQSSLANTITLTGELDQPLVSLRAPANHPRHWRITLHRLNRADQNAPIVDDGNNVLQFVTQQYAYAAGFQLAPVWPPVRSNPVQPGVFRRPNVQIAWGTQNATPARIVADWPMMGASVVVYGTMIDVFASAAGSPGPVQPRATASIVPHIAGLTGDDGELSFTQQIPVNPADPGGASWGGVAYVPDFARRVRVVLVTDNPPLPANPFARSVPITGDIPASLTWFADNQRSVDSAFQGEVAAVAVPGVLVVGFAPVVWHPVPAGATLLSVRGPADFTGTALIHWRVAP